MKKTYWMWRGEGDKMVVWLTDEGVEEMRRRGYTIIPYDPKIKPHEI